MKGILLNDDLTFKITNGSLTIGDTTAQNQKILILANKGEFKLKPMRGVGAARFLEDSDAGDLAREIRTEFIADGMSVNNIKINANKEIEIDANY